MALTKVTGQVINDTTGLVVGVTTVGGGVSATDGFFSGIVTAVGNASFSGNLTVGGVLTYEDVTNVDSVGLITARNGVVVGSGITLSKDGDIFATGVTTATKFVGDGSELTGVASTENIRTNTNATFLQNINVSGSTTTGSLVSSGAVSGTTGTFTGNVDIADKIVHTGDTDTTVRFPTADTVSVETGGNEVLRVTSGRDIVTQGLTDHSFNNDGDNAKVLEITGDGTVGEYGVLNISGNQNSSANVGAIKFLNRENSNSSSGSNANSRRLASIDCFADTSDSNGGDDSGGFLRFVTKADGGGGGERLRVGSAGQLGIAGANYGTSGQVLTSQGSSSAPTWAAGGISNAQQFRLLADQAGSSSAGTVLTNWEESDTDYQAIGSNWSQSSGIFSCSATGIYLCFWSLVVNNTSTGDAYDPNIQISTDSGGSYTTRSRAWAHIANGYVNRAHLQNQLIIDVANAGTFRLRYRQSQDNDVASGTTIAGSSTENLTNIMFIRIGDT